MASGLQILTKIVNKVSQRGLRTNKRSIRYREDLDVSDVTDNLSIPLDSSRTGGLSSVYCTRNYDVDSGQKLVSLEL